MPESAFNTVYPFILQWEAGKGTPLTSFDKGDTRPRPGDDNPTSWGITQDFYDTLPRDQFPRKVVYTLSAAEVESVYRWLWTQSHAAEMPDDVAIAYFDAAVNVGTGQALKFLQRAVQTTPDGAWGPATKAALAAANPREVVVRMLGQRIRFYRDLAQRKPDKAQFLIGWTRRVAALEALLGF